MKRMVLLLVAVASLCGFGDAAVTDITARQRYPWNGLVDISCTVSGIVKDAAHTNDWRFVFAATNTETQARLRVRNLTCGGTKVSSLALTNGTYNLVWDAAKDLGEVQYKNVKMIIEANDDPIPEHESVQLWEGGPYWATTNIGAENPEDYGYYFWWGDTVGYERVNNAWVATDGSSNNFQFYDDPISQSTYGKNNATLESEGWTQNGVLAPEHDAATVHWGDNWRMPTYEELSKLNSSSYCTWTWTTVNGVNGYRVSGQGAYANESIFVPAAGYGNGSSLYGAGSLGYYWSSTPYASYSYYSWYLYFYSSFRNLYDYGRVLGFSVRPVSDFTK